VPGLVKTVGNRPTNSPEETEPPLGGTNPGTSCQPAKQGFINLVLSPHTVKQPHPKRARLGVCYVRAGISYVGKSSMKILLDVIAEGAYGQARHVCTAYYTYVHVDNTGKPAPVPEYVPSNDYERKLFMEGEARRRIRDEELAKVKKKWVINEDW